MSDNSPHPLAMVSVPDGMGGTRLEMRPCPPSKKGGKKQRRPPDPIKANPDAAAQQLRQIVERAERLMEERQGIDDDIRDVFAEGKAIGFDTKGVKAIIKLRKMNPADRQESETIFETYKTALGIA